MVHTPDLDLAWIAGLFEGEGSIQIVRAARGARGSGKDWASYVLRVSISMIDRDAIKLCHDRFGGGRILEYNQKMTDDRHAVVYRWVVNSMKAGEVLNELLPCFRTPRVIQKAQIGIEFQGTKKRGFPIPGYREQQEIYFEKMKALNRRGGPAMEDATDEA